MVYIVWPIDSSSPTFLHPVAIIVKSVFVGFKCFLVFLIRIVVFPLGFSVLPTHTNADLLSDQHQNPAQAAATHPIICIRSHSMMLIKRQQRLTKPHMPANAVRKMHTRMPITFIKVFDTMFSIL